MYRYVGVLLVVLLWGKIEAIVHDKTILTTNTFVTAVTADFGLAKGGLISVEYEAMPKNSSDSWPDKFYVLVLEKHQYDEYYKDWVKASDEGHSWSEESVCSYPSEYRKIASVNSTKQSFEYTVKDAMQYTILVMQCRSSNTPVHYKVKATSLNLTPEGDLNTQLSMGTVQNKYISRGFAIMYAFMSAGVVWQIVTAANRSQVKELHYFFLATVLLYFIAYTVNSMYLEKVDGDGLEDDRLYILVRVLAHSASVVFFITLILLSLGWKTMRENITEKERTFAAPIVMLYIVSGYYAASCSSNTEDNDTCQSMLGVASICRSLMLLGLIIAGNYTVNTLRVFVNLPWAPSVPTYYYLLKQYMTLRNVFILYIILPTIYIIIGLTTLTWRTQYVQALLLESVDLLFILFMITLFAPVDLRCVSRAFSVRPPGHRDD